MKSASGSGINPPSRAGTGIVITAIHMSLFLAKKYGGTITAKTTPPRPRLLLASQSSFLGPIYCPLSYRRQHTSAPASSTVHQLADRISLCSRPLWLRSLSRTRGSAAAMKWLNRALRVVIRIETEEQRGDASTTSQDKLLSLDESSTHPPSSKSTQKLQPLVELGCPFQGCLCF